MVKTNDILGKYLQEFETIKQNGIILPKLFINIYDYFLDEKGKRIKTENIFILKSSAQDLDTIERHISFGNYQYMHQCNDPVLVANYFKCVLKYMAEPLCTY